MSSGRKILVAMSGGVDSSVAAAELRREGHEVVGVFMRLGSPGETLEVPVPAEACDLPKNKKQPKIGHQGCCSINDAADARMVAAELGIPLYVCNFKKDFGRIIDYFVDEYAQGRTPNPCVRCNDWLKFGKLHDYAHQLGCDAVASGHHARIVEHNGSPSLARARHYDKDQSYVLFGIPRAQLSQTLLPVGDYEHKQQLRDKAEALGLPTFDKPDSQEICFVPDQDYAGLVERQRPELASTGKVIDTDGHTVGEHAGQHRFTVGQRRGVGVALGYPIYVVSKDAANNTVTVGSGDDLLSDVAEIGEMNWLDTAPIEPGMRARVQCRSHGQTATATLRPLAQRDEPTPSGRPGRFEIIFDEPQRAIAPGQAAVIYDFETDQRVLGGGWIESRSRLSSRALSPETMPSE